MSCEESLVYIYKMYRGPVVEAVQHRLWQAGFLVLLNAWLNYSLEVIQFLMASAC